MSSSRNSRHISERYQEVPECQHYQRHYCRPVQIGPQHAPVAYAAPQYGNDFCVARQFRSEEYHTDKDEQRTIQVYKSRYEVQVVFKGDFLQRSISAKEVV